MFDCHESVANCSSESFSNDSNDAIQTLCSSVTQADKNEVKTACATAAYANKASQSMETERIEQGGYSEQKFDTINTYFEYSAFSTETIHILPMSRKPVTSNDLKKIYCHECGRKIKSGFKYCPFCVGTAVTNPVTTLTVRIVELSNKYLILN